jgi:hypothetical protein
MYPQATSILQTWISPINPLLNKLQCVRKGYFFPSAYSKDIRRKKSLVNDAKFLNCKLPSYLAEYWQCKKCFSSTRDQLQKELRPKDDLSVQNLSSADMILSRDVVSLDVRRGADITDSHTNQTIGTGSLLYCKKAIPLILRQ